MNSYLLNAIEALKEIGLEAILVNKEVNVSYLTNFDSAESWFLLTTKRCFYITDFRYLAEVKLGLKDCQIIRINSSIFREVGNLVKRLKIKKLGVESKHISLAEFEKLKELLPRFTRVVRTYDFVEKLRQIKDYFEIQKIRDSVNLTIKAFDFVRSIHKVGQKENEVALELERFVRSYGAGFSFNPIIASGSNSSFPHAKVSQRKIASEEPIMVDIGIDLKGYKSDLTRMFFLGKIPANVKKVYRIVLEAQEKSIAKVRAGIKACEIDGQARNHIKNKGLSKFFGHALGHGVGREVHEDPSISSKNDSILNPGMVFTIEPAIYLPGKFGIRLEDVVLVRQNDCEVLSGALDKST